MEWQVTLVDLTTTSVYATSTLPLPALVLPLPTLVLSLPTLVPPLHNLYSRSVRPLVLHYLPLGTPNLTYLPAKLFLAAE